MWNIVRDISQAPPVTWAALLLILCDLAYGCIRIAMGLRHDTGYLLFLEGRITWLVILVVAAVLDAITPDTVTVLFGASIFYIATSAADILDGAHQDGAPMPPQLVRLIHALSKESGEAK